MPVVVLIHPIFQIYTRENNLWIKTRFVIYYLYFQLSLGCTFKRFLLLILYKQFLSWAVFCSTIYLSGQLKPQ